MNVLDRILVPIDGSPSADSAITLALRLARQYDAELIFCHAIDYATVVAEMGPPCVGIDASGWIDALNAGAQELLGAALLRAKGAKVRASAFKLEGRPEDAAIGYGADRRVDAIVMGTRGQKGVRRFFLGSTAEGVLRMATVPVFVVHADSRIGALDAQPGFGTILVAVDESDPSDAAAAFATTLAAGGGTRLALAHIIDDKMLDNAIGDYAGSIESIYKEWQTEAHRLVDNVAQAAETRGVTNLKRSVVMGDPVRDLLELATTSHAGLIAIGTHGRRGLQRFLMGSVAEEVVRRSPIPVVVVRTLAELVHGHSPHYHGTVPVEAVTLLPQPAAT